MAFKTTFQKTMASGLIAVMSLSVAACAEDEDGDGVNTDEEVEELEETSESIAEELEEEVTQTTEAN